MPVDDSKQIMAKNIKYHMDKKGVTNQQLCNALGFKYTTFMDWIKGVTYPRIGKIEAMANYFGCEKSDLIEDKASQEKPADDDGLSESIRALIAAYTAADPIYQQIVLELLESHPKKKEEMK